jgi:flagellar hook-basal body complex protein FliE
MMSAPVAPVGLEPLAVVPPAASPASAAPGGVSFTRMVMDGLGQTNDRLQEADRLTRAFALGEDIPVHQVTFALEQARLSFELVSQVRSRLVESYQELLRMQV